METDNGQVYYPLLYLGIIGAGGRFTGSNPSYTALELNHHVRTAHVKFIISEPSMLPTVLATAKDCNIPDRKIFVFDAVDHAKYVGQRSWQDLLRQGEKDWMRFDDAKQAQTTIATLAFTSGTCGLPKAAMISHHFSVAQVHAIRGPPSKPYRVGSALLDLIMNL